MDYTAIGKIISTHGIKGGLKIYPYTNNVARFKTLKRCFVGEEYEEFRANYIGTIKGLPVISFEGLEDLNKVMKYKDKILYVSDDDRVKLSDWQFFIHDLVGCSVFDDSGNKIGIIKDVYQGPANDVYIIKTEKDEIMVPAVKEFILSVDIDSKAVVVKLIEGMI